MIRRAFNWIKRGRAQSYCGLTVGDVFEVGDFFWVRDAKCIGFAKDARHQNGLSFSGSVAAGDFVTVLGFEGDEAVVRVSKATNPSGAPCPDGMIFLMPVAQILLWPEMAAKRAENDRERAKLAVKYGVKLGARTT